MLAHARKSKSKEADPKGRVVAIEDKLNAITAAVNALQTAVDKKKKTLMRV